jgi:hypothetical protein
VDYENPDNNSFVVANQWTFVENSNKRPDVLVFLNGLPIVLIELKSPSREETDASEAYLQIRNYMQEIPGMFIYNAICVMSDMSTSKAGTITSGEDRFMEWKTADGQYEDCRYANFDVLFTGMFNKRVGQVILKMAGFKLTQRALEIDDKAVCKIAHNIKNMEFAVTGSTGFANAQVTAGGIKTKQFNSHTMESKDCKGLYCIGEILDIDGDCGGFNLQWAWSSAMSAVDAILGENK